MHFNAKYFFSTMNCWYTVNYILRKPLEIMLLNYFIDNNFSELSLLTTIICNKCLNRYLMIVN